MGRWGVQMDKNTQNTMFSSKSNDWGTPQNFYDKLNNSFGPFTLDPCSDGQNNKTDNYYHSKIIDFCLYGENGIKM